MDTSDKIKELEKKLKKVSEGDQVRIDKQHKAGKMTARERIDALLAEPDFSMEGNNYWFWIWIFLNFFPLITVLFHQ